MLNIPSSSSVSFWGRLLFQLSLFLLSDLVFMCAYRNCFVRLLVRSLLLSNVPGLPTVLGVPAVVGVPAIVDVPALCWLPAAVVDSLLLLAYLLLLKFLLLLVILLLMSPALAVVRI
jgi:hypothetical protein